MFIGLSVFLVPTLKAQLLDKNLLKMFTAPAFDFSLLDNTFFQNILKIACPSYEAPETIEEVFIVFDLILC
jgi:hypothetical protein